MVNYISCLGILQSMFNFMNNKVTARGHECPPYEILLKPRGEFAAFADGQLGVEFPGHVCAANNMDILP